MHTTKNIDLIDLVKRIERNILELAAKVEPSQKLTESISNLSSCTDKLCECLLNSPKKTIKENSN
ncbi:hypothetical protein [Bacillus sp. 1P06AnD]|uniref:hypothetical protein n=1 Tax=Bacillus sp. 1P06AnD TaxID=3132208 RepID=UPI00399EFB5C